MGSPSPVSVKAPVPQQPQERFRKPPFAGANPRESATFGAWRLEFLWRLEVGIWSFFSQERGVIAASLPVNETVRVQPPAS